MVQVLVPATYEFLQRKIDEKAQELRLVRRLAAKAILLAVAAIGAGGLAITVAVKLAEILQALVFSVPAGSASLFGAFLLTRRAQGHLLQARALAKERELIRKGIRGEVDVAEKFDGLPDTFAVIHDFQLGEGKSNVDHILFGIKGVVALETKNFAGDYQVTRDHWTKVYPPVPDGSRKLYDMPSNPSRQVRRNAADLQSLLAKCGIRLKVRPAVVMADDASNVEQIDCDIPVFKLSELFASLSGLPTDPNMFLAGRAAQALYERHQNTVSSQDGIGRGESTPSR